MRSASVLGVEANVLWMQLLPMQAVGIVIALLPPSSGERWKKRGRALTALWKRKINISEDGRQCRTKRPYQAEPVLV